MTSSGLKFTTPESLYEWLKPRMKEEDFASWGVKPGTKTTNNLWIELAEGESFLDDSTTPPCRTVSVASLQILNPTDSTKVLIESHQELSDGSVRHRRRPLAEKMKPGETVEAAALRAVKEELGPTYSVRIVPTSYRKKTNERASGSYPGLPGSKHTVDDIGIYVRAIEGPERSHIYGSGTLVLVYIYPIIGDSKATAAPFDVNRAMLRQIQQHQELIQMQQTQIQIQQTRVEIMQAQIDALFEQNRRQEEQNRRMEDLIAQILAVQRTGSFCNQLFRS